MPVMSDAEIDALVRLLRAANAPELLDRHDHATDILVDIVGCKVCWAERELLMSARARLLAQGET